MSDRRADIADTLRGRLLRALNAGTTRRGDRLPSARALKGEFGTDHRLIVDAYRALEQEGLVELRARGGVYVAADAIPGAVPLPSPRWLTEFLVQAVGRDIPLMEVHDWLRRAVETRRLRAVAVQETEDTIAGLCRELSDDYGFEASGVHVNALDGAELPAALRYADVVITTPALVTRLQPVVDRLRKKLIVADVRGDLVGGEWQLLLRRPVYVVVKDAEFLTFLDQFFAGVPGAENIRPVLLGRDPLEAIPEGATVYITRSAQQLMGNAVIRGRVLPAARLFSPDTSRELVTFIVETNLRALTAG